MFQRIFIKENQISNRQVDLGKLCESLLFYNQTDFLLDRFTVEQFVKLISIEKLKEYSDNSTINLHIRKAAIGVAEFPYKNSFVFVPVVTKSKAFELEEQVNAAYKEISQSTATRNTEEFIKLCKSLNYSAKFQEILESECENLNLVQSQLKVYINSYLPTLDLSKMVVELDCKVNTPLGTGYLYKSNFDLVKLNEQYKDLIPSGHTLDWEGFLLRMLESSGDLNISSQFRSELYTDINHEPYLRDRISSLVKHLLKSDDEIQLFQNHVLEEFKPIRDTLNKGERTFDEFSVILDKAQKFRKWLSRIEEDSSLLNAYYTEITKDTWIDKKSTKALRFTFFTALGAIGDVFAGGVPLPSLITSAADNFLIPKLIDNWKPNHFIDNSVKPFLVKK